MNPPTAPYQTELKQDWLKTIQAGLEVKRRHYLQEAEQCEQYYDREQKEIWTSQFTRDLGFFGESHLEGAGMDGNPPRAPIFRVRDNAAAKAVQILVPFFLSGEIVSTVKPHKPFLPPPLAFGFIGDINTPQATPPRNAPLPILQQWAQQQQAAQQFMQAAQQVQMEYQMRVFRGSVIEYLLNYSIKEMSVKDEARTCLRDTLVRGLGALHTEMCTMSNGGRLIADNYLSDDRIVVDPDCKRIKEAKWVAILCEHPTWEVAQMYGAYGITEDMLKPTGLSLVADVTTDYHPSYDPGKQNLFRYWKIYSRCGIGARLKSFSDRSPMLSQLDNALGDYCYLVVSEGCDYPLNLTPQIEQMALQMGGVQSFQIATSWPVPFYNDLDDPWPFTSCWFHERKDSPWPKSHLSFAIGYLNFMAWILGFMAEKAYRDARGVWAIDSSVTEEFTTWLANGQDEEVLKITKGVDGRKIQDLIEYIKGPEFDKSLIDLYEFMKGEFKEMTGLNDALMANYEKQMRSATEAQVVQDSSRLRPDDMATRVQSFLSRVMRKHAIASRYLLTGQDLLTILGQYGAMAWDQGIRTQDVQELFRESSYDVETGKGRPLDIQSDLDNINNAMQFMFPQFVQIYQGTGDPSQLNALIAAWAHARQMDPEPLMLKPFQPLPPAHMVPTPKEGGQK